MKNPEISTRIEKNKIEYSKLNSLMGSPIITKKPDKA